MSFYYKEIIFFMPKSSEWLNLLFTEQCPCTATLTGHCYGHLLLSLVYITLCIVLGRGHPMTPRKDYGLVLIQFYKLLVHHNEHISHLYTKNVHGMNNIQVRQFSFMLRGI
jgi:hypothetical protein